MAGDYVPKSDADFSAWVTNFSSEFGGQAVALGFVAGDITALTAKVNDFNVAVGELTEAHTVLRAAVQTKDDARGALETMVRSIARRIQVRPGVTDVIRTSLGITVRDATPSAPAQIATRPVVQVDSGERLRHTIHFRDQSTPTSKAKPVGTKGCEVWVKIGTPPADAPHDMTFLALDTATPYLAEYEEADAGKMAHYMLRWVNTRDQKGPWSETVEATIGG